MSGGNLMPRVLAIILYIVLFILCLSILIMIHELGHFTAAKIFKVYVQEYSIGFGPALVHKKRKNGETYFSLRVVPFGGYVSMYGEGTELEKDVEVDASRSLEGIRRWKRAIIMAAGVTMNAVLALHIFFIYNVAFTQTSCYYNVASISEGSIAYQAGLKTGDYMAFDSYVSKNENDYKDNLHLLDNASVITNKDGSTTEVFTYLNLDNFVNYKEENLKFSKFIAFYQSKIDGEIVTVDYSKQVSVDANFSSLKLTLSTLVPNEETKEVDVVPHEMIVASSDGTIEDIGYSLYLDVQKPLPFFKALGQSFVDFGNSSIVIFKALGTLFTKSTWESMGGIVAIGFQTTSILENFGWGRFIYIWGVLSVNLAIVNLLPFPGLDGWQLLVLAVEGISKKKIPNKVKTIVSLVGIGLLFTFMIVLVFKDFFTYIL